MKSVVLGITQIAKALVMELTIHCLSLNMSGYA